MMNQSNVFCPPNPGIKINIRRDSTVRTVTNELSCEPDQNNFDQNGADNEPPTSINTVEPMEQNDIDNIDDIEIDFDEINIKVNPQPKTIKLILPKAFIFKEYKPMQLPTTPTPTPKPIRKQLGIESILPNICFPFLRDECVEFERCLDSHEFPSDDEMYERLVKYKPEQMSKLFHIIIARHPNLLNRFFKIFMEYFALHVHRAALVKTIDMCEREPELLQKIEKYRFLIKSFMQSGFTIDDTMTTILKAINDSNGSLSMVLDPRVMAGVNVGNILNIVKALDATPEYAFNGVIINYLMEICIKTKNADLTSFCAQFAVLQRRRRIAGLNKGLQRNFCDLFVQLRRTGAIQRKNGKKSKH